MNIIAAHQQGLIEQLEGEVSALSGRPSDFGQRAVVLHHIYDHSRGGHGWALAEARRNLRIAEGLAALEQRIGRWGWLIPRKDEARAALASLRRALGEASMARCAAAYRAYRLSGTQALRDEAERVLAPDLLEVLDRGHAVRRTGDSADPALQNQLLAHCEAIADATVDGTALAAAWTAISASPLKRAARKMLGDRALAKAAARDARRGLQPTERSVRNDPTLPASFRANPAQHFYALQLALAEKRRQQWREACDREPGSFELAA
jgi:hypothetical protein